MRSWPRRCVCLIALLGLCAAFIVDARPEAGEPPVDAAAQLDEILQDPLFSRWELRQARASSETTSSSRMSGLFERWGQRLEDFIEWLFRDRTPTPSMPVSSGSGGAGLPLAEILKALGWVVLAIAVALILWMVVSWLGVIRPRGRASAPTRDALDTALREQDALAAAPEAWVAHAQTLADEQDLRQAFRAVFLALLSGLHSAGHIRYRPQRTNWTYVRSFRGPDPQRDAFRALTDRFDDVWYGHRAPDPDEFDTLKQRVATLLHTPAGTQPTGGTT